MNCFKPEVVKKMREKGKSNFVSFSPWQTAYRTNSARASGGYSNFIFKDLIKEKKSDRIFAQSPPHKRRNLVHKNKDS
jgi:hypothetical protein